jgi:dynein heavy chain 2
MGGGINAVATQLLKNGAEQGFWIFLKNLHLVPDFMNEVDKLLSTMKKHADFRLIATTEEHENFPAILLERCFKINYETPPGLKKNIERAYGIIQEGDYKDDENQSKMMFVLSFFHAIVQERRNYVPQGWSKNYEFSFADLIAAFKLFKSQRF